MRFGKALTAVAVATSLVATPVMAGAENLSVASAQRDAAPAGQEENLKGGSIFIALIGFAVIISAIIVAFDENDEDLPTSP